MPDPQDPNLYTTKFAELVQHVAIEGKPLEVECHTAKAAYLLRREFYAYKRALREAGDAVMFSAASLIVASLNETTLRFSNRDQSQGAQLLAEALKKVRETTK